jgi:hypothetical protein
MLRFALLAGQSLLLSNTPVKVCRHMEFNHFHPDDDSRIKQGTPMHRRFPT